MRSMSASSTSRLRTTGVVDGKIVAEDPGHAHAFYSTSNQEYSGHWFDGTRATSVGDVPRISEILGARATIKRPPRPLRKTAQTILGDTIEMERKRGLADRVLSADVVPKKFPVEAQNVSYPASGKRGTDNPLYATSAQAYGSKVPMAHQVADRYFPMGNQFTNEFVDLKPRYSGLNTAPSKSRTHKALDEYC